MDDDEAIRRGLPEGLGEQVLAFIRSERGLDRFEALNDHGIPPVADVSLFLHRIKPDLALGNMVKQRLGKAVYDALRTRDPSLQPKYGVRVTPAPYNRFRTGSVFERRALESS